MKLLGITLFVLFFSFSAQARQDGYWPISGGTGNVANADVVTSPFGPRQNGTFYQIHYGMDIQAAANTDVYSVLPGVVLDVGDNIGGGIGTYIRIGHADGTATMHMHLNQRYVGVGYTIFQSQLIGKSGGTGAGAQNPHLHLEYYKTNVLPLDETKDTDNPMIILPHQTSDPYEIAYPAVGPGYEYAGIYYPPYIEFHLYVNRKRLDFNRIEVELVDPTDVDGNYASSATLMNGESGSLQPPGASFSSSQELGVIDLSNRIGYDFGPRGQNGRPASSVFQLWNGVEIFPWEYPSSEYEVIDHCYYIVFYLDEEELKRLRGGLNQIMIRVKDYNGDIIAERTINRPQVYWREEWPYNTFNYFWPAKIEVGAAGQIILKNQSSSESNHPQFPGELIIRSGGLVQLEAGSSGQRTWFSSGDGYTSSGYNLWIQSGGQLVLGNYSRLVYTGITRFDSQPTLGVDAQLIDGTVTGICETCPPYVPINVAADISGNNVVLTWDPPDVDAIGIKVYKDQNYVLLGNTATTHTYSNAVSSLPSTFKVGAYNSYGESISESITLINASGPTLISPSNNATGASISPILSWNTVPNAISYNLRWSTSGNFTNPTVTTVPSNSHIIYGLAKATTYFWQVNANTGEGTTDWSPTWSFTTTPNMVQVSGTISSNSAWSGEYNVTGSVTVNSGVTLTIMPGSLITFNAGTSLVVNGKLLANGNSGSKITFTSTGSQTAGSWGNITLSGSGASNSSIKYANIKYGNEISVLNGASNVLIQNCTIDTVKYGIVFNNATGGSVRNNTLTSNTIYHGIRLELGTYTVNNNKVTKVGATGSGAGIQFGTAGGYVYQNDVKGWNWGIAAIWGASPDFYGAFDNRNNRVTNCLKGIVVYKDSYPDVGWPISGFWGNSIYNNTKNVALNTSYSTVSTLPAQAVWWGSDPPNTSLFQIGTAGSVIDYAYWLSYDPWDGIPSGAAPTPPPIYSPSAASNPTTEDEDSFQKGKEMQWQGRLREAKDYFLAEIAKNPDNRAAYVRLYNSYNEGTADELIDFFSGKRRFPEHTLLLSSLYTRRGNSEMARKVNNDLIEANPNTAIASRAKLNNAYLALYTDNNVGEAAKLYNEVAAKPELTNEMELGFVEQAIESHAAALGQETPHLQAASGLEQQQATQTDALQSYPNPFNPTTQIRYSIKDAGYVSLKVYDLLGREVAVLVNEEKQSGAYSVEWNAGNLSSGMYFSRLESGGRAIIQKLLLVR